MAEVNVDCVEKLQVLRGMADLLPEQTILWQTIEATMAWAGGRSVGPKASEPPALAKRARWRRTRSAQERARGKQQAEPARTQERARQRHGADGW